MRTGQGQRGAGSEGAEEGEACGTQGQAVEEGRVGGGGAQPLSCLALAGALLPRPSGRAKPWSCQVRGRSFHFVVFKIFS